MNIVIIGGVAAGTKVAAKLKREDRDANVIVLTKGKDISYAGCGLPYYVGNIIKNKEELIVNTPEKLSRDTGAIIYNNTEVVSIDRNNKTVKAVNLLNSEEKEYPYDKLVIAVGANPIKPNIEGIDLDGVFFMRTPDDAITLRERVEAGGLKRAVVVGGGYIGLEIADNLNIHGIRTTVIDMAETVPPGFDIEFSQYIENHLAENGIMVFTNDALQSIEGDGKVEKVITSQGKMKADVVVLSVGIKPATDFLADSGLEFAKNGSIIVNDHLQTNDESIYAVGDCAFVKNSFTEEGMYSPMGSTANITGRIVAQNIKGADLSYRGAVGTAVAHLPELNIGRTGFTVKDAVKAGFDPVSVVSVVDDKAHYFPGASNFIIKLIADRNSKKLIGLQVLGQGNVDKIVDIGVTAITLKANVEDLQNMDLAYAPPFSTAIHPFDHAVNILLNKLEGKLETIEPQELLDSDFSDYKFVDASLSPSLSNAKYLDLGDIEGEVDGLDVDEKVALICTKGKRAYMVQNRLKHFGYKNTKVVEGGELFNKYSDVVSNLK